jgi:DNA-binding transcriptional LysR family regulator
MESAVELVWLEDFLEIVATRNFSSAAAARNISQSAFSRRIKSLEAWIGTELIDRSTYPVRLTAAGTMFVPHCQDLTRDIYRVRSDCLNLAGAGLQSLSFAALHTLAIYFYPGWFSTLVPAESRTRSSMHAGDFLECIEKLSLGKCDFALVYDHPDGLPVLETGPFESVLVGRDVLVPVSGTDATGHALFSLEPPDNAPVPFLAYTWNDGYLGKLISLIRARRPVPLNLATVYESALAEGLKQMAIAGAGIAWLPLICARDALDAGRLVQIGGPHVTLDMQIRLFRRAGRRGRDDDALWTCLQRRADSALRQSHANIA